MYLEVFGCFFLNRVDPHRQKPPIFHKSLHRVVALGSVSRSLPCVGMREAKLLSLSHSMDHREE